MKISLILLVLAFHFAQSQDMKTSSSTVLINEKGSGDINLDFAYTTDLSRFNWEGFGTGISFTYAILNRINIGLEPFFGWVNSKTYSGQPYSPYFPFHVNGPPFSYYKKENFSALDLKVQYYWIDKQRVGLYSGLDVGIYATGTDITAVNYGGPIINPPYPDLSPDHYYHTGINKYTLIGIEEALGKSHWIFISEFGWGLRGVINVGLGYHN